MKKIQWVQWPEHCEYNKRDNDNNVDSENDNFFFYFRNLQKYIFGMKEILVLVFCLEIPKQW